MLDEQEELLKRHDIVIHTYKNNNITNISKLLKEVMEITTKKENSIIQLLNTKNICGKKHLNQAIAQAIKAFDEKQNFANDKGLEICVRLSTQKQITEALAKLGIQIGQDITVLYIDTDKTQINETELLLGKKEDNLIEEYDLETIKNVYSISEHQLNNYSIVDLINEKIALLSLKN